MYPIHWAAIDGKVSSIAFLLSKNEYINIQDANGCSPVVIATQHNHHDCVMYLILNGADMNLCDSNGDNALHWAAYKGYVEMIGLLSRQMTREINFIDDFGQVITQSY
jgi:ankyrin repeat protein